jgi:hypothetical protein
MLHIQFFVNCHDGGQVLLKLDCPITSLYLNTIICNKCFVINQLTNFLILENYMHDEKLIYDFFVIKLNQYTFKLKI